MVLCSGVRHCPHISRCLWMLGLCPWPIRDAGPLPCCRYAVLVLCTCLHRGGRIHEAPRCRMRGNSRVRGSRYMGQVPSPHSGGRRGPKQVGSHMARVPALHKGVRASQGCEKPGVGRTHTAACGTSHRSHLGSIDRSIDCIQLSGPQVGSNNAGT